MNSLLSFASLPPLLPLRPLAAVAALFLFSSCSSVTVVDGIGSTAELTQSLTDALVALPGAGERTRGDAAKLADTAVRTSQELAERYEVFGTPGLHNTLVNTGIKERGLCWQWMEDFFPRLANIRQDSFDLVAGVRDPDRTFLEHHCVVAVPKGRSFQDGLVLDPWVKSGRLVALRVSENPRWLYDDAWTKHLQRLHPVGGAAR